MRTHICILYIILHYVIAAENHAGNSRFLWHVLCIVRWNYYADEIGIANYVVFSRPRPHCVHHENSKNPPKLVVNGWVPIWRTHITYDIHTSCHIPSRPSSVFCSALQAHIFDKFIGTQKYYFLLYFTSYTFKVTCAILHILPFGRPECKKNV